MQFSGGLLRKKLTAKSINGPTDHGKSQLIHALWDWDLLVLHVGFTISKKVDVLLCTKGQVTLPQLPFINTYQQLIFSSTIVRAEVWQKSTVLWTM